MCRSSRGPCQCPSSTLNGVSPAAAVPPISVIHSPPTKQIPALGRVSKGCDAATGGRRLSGCRPRGQDIEPAPYRENRCVVKAWRFRSVSAGYTSLELSPVGILRHGPHVGQVTARLPLAADFSLG